MGVLPTKDGDKPQRLDCANSSRTSGPRNQQNQTGFCNKGRRANHWNGVCILYVDMHLLEVGGDGRPHESLASCVWKKFEDFDQLHIR